MPSAQAVYDAFHSKYKKSSGSVATVLPIRGVFFYVDFGNESGNFFIDRYPSFDKNSLDTDYLNALTFLKNNFSVNDDSEFVAIKAVYPDKRFLFYFDSACLSKDSIRRGSATFNSTYLTGVRPFSKFQQLTGIKDYESSGSTIISLTVGALYVTGNREDYVCSHIYTPDYYMISIPVSATVTAENRSSNSTPDYYGVVHVTYVYYLFNRSDFSTCCLAQCFGITE